MLHLFSFLLCTQMHVKIWLQATMFPYNGDLLIL